MIFTKSTHHPVNDRLDGVIMASKETSLKMPADQTSTSESQFNLEGILSELGSFGKYQLLLLLLLAFRDSFLVMCNYNYMFAAAEVDFRCYVPECEQLDPRFNASWRPFALNNTKTCQRHAPQGPWSGEWNTSVTDVVDECTPERFQYNETMRCDRIVYENQNSVVAEFDLGCEPWKRTMIGTVHNLGLVFSFFIAGFVSDRYGRKTTIVCTSLAVGFFGLVKSFAVNYWMLLIFEFLETSLGYGNASMVLTLESVTQKQRVVFSCISDMLANFGGAFFGLIAWKVPYWRHMMRAIYTPLLVVVFYIFLVDEGVRWLLAHNKKDEAVRVLNKVAKVNNITLSKAAKEMLSNISEERSKVDQENQTPVQGGGQQLLVALRSKKILLRLVLIACCFFCCMFVNYGVIINSTGISGDKYLNFSIMILVAIPTSFVTAITLTRFGRKKPICIAYTLCAFFFIASAFVPKSISWASMLLYVMGKMCSSYGIFSVTVVALEMFPTTSRNSLTNTANTFGRLGAVLAPQAPLLGQFMPGLPSIVFGVAALGPAILSLVLPDTSKAALPDHVSEAERLGDEGEQTDDALEHSSSGPTGDVTVRCNNQR